jgi:two-component system chemotaxis sensor kinase CheA
MDDMLKDFVVEAMDLAVNVEASLLKLEKSPGDMEALNAVFRAFHTIKGGAGFMNLGALVSACHLTENLFDALRTGFAPVTQTAIDAALEASSFVADQLAHLANGEASETLQPLLPALEKKLVDAIHGITLAPDSAAVAAAPQPAATAPGTLDWQAYYDAIVPAVAAASPAVAPLPASDWEGIDRRGTGIDEVKAPVREDSIRIDSSKLDILLEVAGESVQATNQAGVLLEKLMQYPCDSAAAEIMKKLVETLNRGARYSTELQHATLSARMQPVGRLFQKFPRLVRELARDLGKEVELVIEGAETEVDRVVVEGLYDPLVHMLRNALDHGIESRDERAASGKPARARILLKASQQGSTIMIELADDGKGIDADHIRSKALAKGLIGEYGAQSEEEALNLIFLPGFSTRDVASSVSGRGVGMDVVKTAVEKHRGVVSIEARPGSGTRFLIRLPIEMAIVPTMLVSTAGAALGMPMAIVERVVELPPEMRNVIGNPVFLDQGRPLPVKSLARLLGYAAGEESIGIVVNAAVPYILSVEAVDGTADLVIKPLTSIRAPGITGTSRSAEGELVLIVSVSFLLHGGS